MPLCSPNLPPLPSTQQSDHCAFPNAEGQNDHLNPANLATQARRAFSIIEVWRQHPSSDHENIIVGIVKQGRAYTDAIKQSVATAEAGSTLTGDAISSCERLMTAQGPSAELENALRAMKENVERAHQGSKHINNEFKRIRVELFAVHPTYQSAFAHYQPLQQIAKMIPEPISPVEGEHLVELNPHAIDNAQMHAQDFRISNESVCSSAISQFQKAASDLDSLITHVASFVDWWADMNISLQYIETNLRFITADGSNPFRVNSVKEHWLGLQQKYEAYLTQIHAVEDYHRTVSSDKWLSAGKSDTKSVGDEKGHSETMILPVSDDRRCCIIM